ncbi:GNAT family N-acetyltransferase [Paludicola sp. MB14-C6]|uniref:GNAT family N-acetyltransferase n=1 Tax=Paludihabitans sp. MB14-C6 TaxID=3070656 RepID=UPI0027DADFB1|nr:GNAT family N-acetyltransferase [Paludicola sp. MB14-C6]WMJ22498.1 GNAT family N-acetyltransferase [Paludicola sp. MB14-C6]
MIAFKQITEHNFEECIALTVREHQKTYVSTNVYSLAEAWLYPNAAFPFAIYEEENMVGFIMFAYEDGKYYICRFMIDEKYQQKGYGKDALKSAIQYLIDTYQVTEIYLSVEPDNVVAKGLYQSVGFLETGEMLEAEELMKFTV